jgi:hypothetical protein
MIFNSIIPLPYYTPLFYNIIFVLVLFKAFQLHTKGYVIQNSNKKDNTYVLLVGVFLYMGLRPISWYFGDMINYNNKFIYYSNGGELVNQKDFLFDVFTKFCSGIMSAEFYFLICAILYVLPLFLACKKWFGANSYIPFLMLIASFTFWQFGANGIRNGIATSLFVLAISYKKKTTKYGILLIAFFIHGSIIIPITAYLLTLFNKNTKYYFLGWLVAIPLSIILGSFWENFFTSLGFGGERINYLVDDRFQDRFSSIGFRWDFLAYSASAVFTGYYFIFKKKFNDKRYIQLFNIYLIANAFWILVIRASYSARFAYLSWFLMAIVIFFPFFKQRFFKNQGKVLAFTMLGFSGFTFFLFLIGKL